MALDAADLAKLAEFIDTKIESGFQVFKDVQAAAATANREAVVGRPSVEPDAGPLFYIHLANGDVITSHDSGSTHMDVNGEQVAVIGRYQKGA